MSDNVLIEALNWYAGSQRPEARLEDNGDIAQKALATYGILKTGELSFYLKLTEPEINFLLWAFGIVTGCIDKKSDKHSEYAEKYLHDLINKLGDLKEKFASISKPATDEQIRQHREDQASGDAHSD